MSPAIVGTFESGNVIFDSLDMKVSGVQTIQNSACDGAEIIDTEDFYADVCGLYPELGVAKISARHKFIGDHYKQGHASSKGKHRALFIFTHAAVVGAMP